MPEKQPKTPRKSPFMEEAEHGTYVPCAGGDSDNPPYCDGTYGGTGFEPVWVQTEEEDTVAWVGCKWTGNHFTGDGTHSPL